GAQGSGVEADVPVGRGSGRPPDRTRTRSAPDSERRRARRMVGPVAPDRWRLGRQGRLEYRRVPARGVKGWSPARRIICVSSSVVWDALALPAHADESRDLVVTCEGVLAHDPDPRAVDLLVEGARLDPCGLQ